MKTKHLACCGFDCGNCPFFIYTETRDAELGKKLIEKFSTPQKTFTTDAMLILHRHTNFVPNAQSAYVPSDAGCKAADSAKIFPVQH